MARMTAIEMRLMEAVTEAGYRPLAGYRPVEPDGGADQGTDEGTDMPMGRVQRRRWLAAKSGRCAELRADSLVHIRRPVQPLHWLALACKRVRGAWAAICLRR